MWHPGIASNMNFPAPVAVLGFLAAIAGLVLGAVTVLTLLFLRKAKLTRWLGALVGIGAFVYFGLLFAMSLASREATIPPGQEKYFCEIDCHLAYSVRNSREDVQNGQRQLRVTLRTRFDETTISPHRPKDAPLTPNPRTVALLDAHGSRWPPTASSGILLTTPL